MLISNIAVVFAEERFNLGFNQFQSQFKFNDSISDSLSLKELKGRVNLKNDLALDVGYTFGDYSNYINAGLQDIDVAVTKDFLPGDTRLALGAGVNYSNFNTSFFNQDLFSIKSTGVSLVADFEKNITDKISISTNLAYNLGGNYEVTAPVLEEYVDLGKLTNYKVDSSYAVQSGFNFRVTPEVKAKIGYRLKQEKIKNSEFSSVLVNDYNLAQIEKLNQGVFFGVETKF